MANITRPCKVGTNYEYVTQSYELTHVFRQSHMSALLGEVEKTEFTNLVRCCYG